MARASALFVICGVAMLLRLAPFTANSAMVPLVDSGGNDSGWVAWFDSSLDPFLDITANVVDFGQDAVFITKFAQFTQSSQNGVSPRFRSCSRRRTRTRFRIS
jgi:hypothetical protein